jgi:transcriptional regulator GlxA family with amidase domain
VDVAILLYDGMTALDAVGPYEVLSRLPRAEVLFVAAEPGPKRTDNGMLALVADMALEDVPAPNVLVVPGGWGHVDAAADPAVLDWVRSAHATSRWTCSVCTGSLILGAAGLLRGLRATTHWRWRELLADHGAVPTAERVVREGRVWTSAGVSAGIDLALRLAAEEAGEEYAQAIQLSLEYDPQPPFDAGSPHKAPAEVVELLRNLSRFEADAEGAPTAAEEALATPR